MLIILLILSIVLLTGSFSYAIFTSNIEHNNALNIITGNLYSVITSDDLVNNQITVPTGSTYLDITVTNVNSRDVKVNLYYSADANVEITYDINHAMPPSREGMVLTTYGSESDKIILRIRIDNNSGSNQLVTLGSDAGLFDKELTFPSDKRELSLDYGSCFRFIQNTVTDYHSSCPKDVVIPSTINNEQVLAVGNSAFMEEGIISVSFPNTLQTIGSTSFYKNNLTNLIIPNSVTTIGDSAFRDNQITNVVIPNSVTNLGSLVLNNNQLPDNEAFIYERNTSGTETTKLISYGGSNRNNIEIPNNTTVIGASSFIEQEISKVVIPTSVTTIEASAFQNNILTTINIPNSVTTIGSYALRDNQLTTYTGMNGVTSLGSGILNNNLLSDSQAFIYKRNSNGTIDNTSIVSYGGAKKDNVVIPSQVTDISNYAFVSVGLKSVTLNNNVTSIGYRAFAENELNSIHLPQSIYSIASYAFYSNEISNLTSERKIEDILKAVGIFNKNLLPTEQSFMYNSANPHILISYGGASKDIIIPNQFTIIQESAFNNTELNSVILPNSITEIGVHAFFGNNLTTIDIPSSVTTIGYGALGQNMLVDEEAFIYKRNSDGTIDYTTIIGYGGARKENVVIPEGVTTIVDYGMRYGFIESLTLPSTLTTIGNNAFDANNITEVTIPESVTLIGNNAFNIRFSYRLEITVDGKSNASDFASLGNNWQGDVGMVIYNP